MPTEAGRTRPPAWRILIAGGGPPGLALALALARGLGPSVSVTVCDPAFGSARPDGRAYAVSAGAVRLLEGLGLWGAILPDAQPIRSMAITDSRLADVVRPIYLTFDGADEPLGFMVEAERLGGALLGACREAGIELAATAVADFTATGDRIEIATAAGEGRIASLMVACDGARSRLREIAGIGWVGRRYPQAGIVATVAHEHDHEGRAVQHFLPSGSFAMLPLGPGSDPARHRSSIVWTERRERVPALLALPPAKALREVELRFGRELGEIELETQLSAHPLSVGTARSFVAARFALVGDAAHEIHPLAGQGLNLGLADAAALAERVAGSVRLGLDPGRDEVLRAYQQDRRFDALALAATTDGLNRLFSNDVLPARVLRDLGLGLVDRAPGAKRFFARQAAGATGRAPGLMRGEVP